MLESTALPMTAGIAPLAEHQSRWPVTRVRVVALHHSEVVRRGLGSMLSMLPSVDVTDYEDAATTAALADAGSADVLIVPPEWGDHEFHGLRESLAGSHPKVLVLLRDHDHAAVQRALAVHADGFLLESELTSVTLDKTLSRCRPSSPARC
jgi:DNA-binding NarL/FixJ family response regulator